MFGFPWVGGKRQEKVADGGLKLLAAKQQNFGVVEALAITAKLKRKRRDSEEIATTVRKPKKRKPEYMSHVEVPRSVAHVNTPDASLQAHILSENTTNILARGNQGPQTEHSLQVDQSLQTDRVSQTDSINPMEKDSVSDSIEATAAQIDSARQVIERQFGLEILLKHRELRLIEQELAKAQIAYEQLRRCRIIPFPQPVEQIGYVPAATGRMRNPPGGSSGQNLAPIPGVVDGPYTRHLSRWLLPDPLFDARGDTLKKPDAPRKPKRASTNAQSKTTSAAKAGPSPTTASARSRSKRGSTTSRLASSAGGPKEDKVQRIVQRSSDNQWVRLVCPDCGNSNFSNTQGFINHCRISHHRHFATHDTAAEACGEVVEFDESGAVVGGSNSDIAHPFNRLTFRGSAVSPPTPTASSILSKNKRKRTKSQSGNLDEASEDRPHQHQRTSTYAPEKVLNELPMVSFAPQTAFIPSPLAPHLSLLFTKRRTGGDLKQMVDEAKIKIDIDAIGSKEASDGEEASDVDHVEKGKVKPNIRFALDGTDETEVASGRGACKPGFLTTRGLVRGGRLPARATVSPAPLDRPTSKKGLDRHASRLGKANANIPHSSYTKFIDRQSTHTHPGSIHTHSVLSGSRPLVLSPNTVEFNPAPSLVSDDGDYEDAHESEAPSSTGGDGDEDTYMNVEVEDEEVCGSTADPELATASKARSAMRKAGAPRRRTSVRGSQSTRCVSFASQAKLAQKGEGKLGGRGASM
ncbi:hypothetical protein MMC14_000202 [Varicellaria rhodocarpa]|nr:hypothetical protein [Varicellaria rhodocarpa]